ncbi:hypothetical protein EYF80_058760 [Liparis tanakae]|uniref:Secreted protein n=1 Tax=Liparis tanakae TaxID=230148 RepID=A0A4Z2EQL2_9TELE|nr:hypothetical protein EYF80_058760 [Liparis tanakae]
MCRFSSSFILFILSPADASSGRRVDILTRVNFPPDAACIVQVRDEGSSSSSSMRVNEEETLLLLRGHARLSAPRCRLLPAKPVSVARSLRLGVRSSLGSSSRSVVLLHRQSRVSPLETRLG